MLQLPTFSRLNHSLEPQYHDSSEYVVNGPFRIIGPATKPTASILGYSNLVALALLVFLVVYWKNFPGLWHMRILNAFRFILKTQQPSVELKPSHIFQPMITTSSAQVPEIDFNLHKSNSTYFSDVDVSRTHLTCTLFAKGIATMRGGTSAYTGSGKRPFGLALGAVSCNFRKEVAPYQQYEMWSRILSWDEKWVYIVTHFVRADAAKPRSSSLYPEQYKNEEPLLKGSVAAGKEELPTPLFTPETGLHATALSKCVFKSGRETVSPKKMLELSGLVTADMDEAELHQIEEQRKEGFRTASTLATENQRALEAEFRGSGGEVLGRHTDGTGVIGVVNTLMQLAKLKKSQVL